MKRLLPYPVAWLALVVMWVVLNGTLSPGHVMIGMIVAFAGVRGLAALDVPSARLRSFPKALMLVAIVLGDIVRSNIAVARVVAAPAARRGRPGFVDIPLELDNEVALVGLACIITATPGTCWAGYDPDTRMLTMHVLDLVDDEASRRAIKDRYERRLMEIFE
jgi:multicomponent K+:H+ antiporter subunit E